MEAAYDDPVDVVEAAYVNPVVVSKTDPMVVLKTVDISEYVFPTQGGTVRTEDVSEASSRSSTTLRSSPRLVTS